MSKFQDSSSRFHDKQTDGESPSSNNGFIYSAYAEHIVPELLRRMLITDYLDECIVDLSKFQINRKPNDPTPPMSKDEVIGILSIYKGTPYGKRLYESLKRNHWNFCNLPEYEKKPLNLNRIITAVDALIELKDYHRNYVWENKVVEAYPLAFRLPPEDIYYIMKLYGERPSLFDTAAFYANAALTLYKGDKSSKMLLWLRIKDLKMEKSFIGKRVIKRETEFITNYFKDKNHPFVKKVLDK